MFQLTKKEISIFSKLTTPQKIQNFLDSVPYNYEKKGETCMSPVRVLQNKKANCIEGAMLAATALWLQGEKPLILSLKVTKDDYYHAVALFKQNGYWGAISKTNHAVLRFRDPIYKNIRELALSYFHEYYLSKNGKKTLRGYSKPINLKQFGIVWVTSQTDLWDMVEKIYFASHTQIIPKKNEKFIRPAQVFERKVTDVIEWKKTDRRT